MIGVRIYVVAKGAASGSSGRYLGSTGSGGGVLTHALTADRARQADEAKRAAYAAEADHARTADDFAPGSAGEGRFVRKDRADQTPYDLTVGGTLTAEDVIQSLQYMSGLLGFGWGGDKKGNFWFESIGVRSFMEIAELIVNRQETIEGDAIYTEGDTIEEVTDHGDGTYTLKLHPKWDGYTTAQIEHNVLKGIYNNITGALPDSDTGITHINGAYYYTSWFRVLTVNAAANTIDVVLYPDDEVPAGRNFPPCEMMKFSRWGNSGSADDERYAQRQHCLYVSSTEGRILKLFGVTKPIIDKGNVAVCIGNCPEFLDGVAGLKAGEQIVYAQKMVAERFLEHDYEGRGKPEIRFTGAWDPAKDDYQSGDVLDTEALKYWRDLVEHYGCQWLCSKTGTREEPSWKSTDWTFYLGDPSFKIWFTGGPAALNPSRFSFTLKLNAEKYNRDVLADILSQDIVWSRYSETEDGTPRVASDNVWCAKRAGSGTELKLTQEDLDVSAGFPTVCIFTATATLRDGTSEMKAAAKLNINA